MYVWKIGSGSKHMFLDGVPPPPFKAKEAPAPVRWCYNSRLGIVRTWARVEKRPPICQETAPPINPALGTGLRVNVEVK